MFCDCLSFSISANRRSSCSAMRTASSSPSCGSITSTGPNNSSCATADSRRHRRAASARRSSPSAMFRGTAADHRLRTVGDRTIHVARDLLALLALISGPIMFSRSDGSPYLTSASMSEAMSTTSS